MLFSFTIGNYRSFSARKTLSLYPAAIKEFPQNLIRKGGHVVLSSAALYGANSSGKSNLLRGISMMKRIVLESFDQRSVTEIPYDPFLLNTANAQQPTFFEAEFWVGTIKYRYGFEADRQSIKSEWLFECPKRNEKPLFIRIPEGIEVMPQYVEGRGLEEKTRDNALFLSVVDQFNGRIAATVMAWFRNLNIISGLSHDDYREITFSMLDKPETNELLAKYYAQLDLGFERIRMEKKAFPPNELPLDLPEDLLKQFIADYEGAIVANLRTVHKVFDQHKRQIGETEFEARRQESSGTNKLIDLSGPIFHTLKEGGILVADELDAKLHPLLTRSIVRLFQDAEINRNGAQLIFASHDTNLLSMCDLRRDQIYFVEKNQVGASDLFALVEYNEPGKGKVRKDRSYEKDYLSGRYGAIPYFGNFTSPLGNGAKNKS